MKTSTLGKKLIKDFEGCKLSPYRDAVGLWTVGYGHLMSTNEIADMETLTKEGADDLLAQDLEKHEAGLNKTLGDRILARTTQGQFDAMISLSFNVGISAVRKSTLLRLFCVGDIEDASAEFNRWSRAGGKVLKGLVRRRAAERKLFETGVYP